MPTPTEEDKRTPAEVAAEIAALKTIQPRIRRYTMFHDDNHAAVAAQIALLEAENPEEAIDDYSIEDDEHTYFAVSTALEWLLKDRDEAPSADWADLIIE